MTGLRVEYYNHIKDYIHPNLHTFIEHYWNGDLINLPPFHGCSHRNRNGTNKLINYSNGHQCITPSWRNKNILYNYWKKNIKPKYKSKIGFFYVTRYMTQTNFRHLFKNKGYLVYNYKLKKYEHMNKTPLHHEYKSIWQFKNEYFLKNALSQKA